MTIESSAYDRWYLIWAWLYKLKSPEPMPFAHSLVLFDLRNVLEHFEPEPLPKPHAAPSLSQWISDKLWRPPELPTLDLKKRLSPVILMARHDDYTLAQLAAACGSHDSLEYLLDFFSIDVNTVDEDGNTALHTAVRCSNLRCIEVLLRHEAVVNIRNKAGMTPLHLIVTIDDEMQRY